MRIPVSEHHIRPWRIHSIAPDFRLEDVWRLPVSGERGDFAELVELFAGFDESDSGSVIARTLFAIRWKLGELFGWDDPGAGVGSRVASLRHRLPDDLRDGPAGPAFAALAFTSIYQTDDEWAAEVANETMHGILHLGWVPDEAGTYHAQMAVLVKPNGWRGAAYMAAIKPFRYVAVYPQLERDLGRAWAARTTTEATCRPQVEGAAAS